MYHDHLFLTQHCDIIGRSHEYIEADKVDQETRKMLVLLSLKMTTDTSTFIIHKKQTLMSGVRSSTHHLRIHGVRAMFHGALSMLTEELEGYGRLLKRRIGNDRPFPQWFHQVGLSLSPTLNERTLVIAKLKSNAASQC